MFVYCSVDDPDLWNQTLEAEELLEAAETHETVESEQQPRQGEPRRAVPSHQQQVPVVAAAPSNVVKKRRVDAPS
jgi:hypothetical protein